MIRVEKIVFDCLVYRGYANSEAQKFIRVLKGEEEESALSEEIINQIDSVLRKHTDRVTEYEKVLKDNRELRIKNAELSKYNCELESFLDEKEKRLKRINTLAKTTIRKIEAEAHACLMTIINNNV